MKSSQALAQTVFGNLCAAERFAVLDDLATEEGARPFQGISADPRLLCLERAVTWLGEPRPTSIDVSICGNPAVAIECKFTEGEVGSCSRPKLNESEADHCSGAYQLQRGRSVRCALTFRQIKYWHFTPMLFDWDANADHAVCPMRSTYQLVRNILAASVARDGNVVEGFALLLYDDRNPAFQLGGRGYTAYDEVKTALVAGHRHRLQRLSWQTLVAKLRTDDRLRWLTSELQEKYGF